MNFYLTFGQQYRRVRHPIWSGCHPDGYILIEAENYRKARKFVIDVFQNRYCELYKQDEFDNDKYLFPCGVLKMMYVPNDMCYNVSDIVKELRGDSE